MLLPQNKTVHCLKKINQRKFSLKCGLAASNQTRKPDLKKSEVKMFARLPASSGMI